MIWDYENQKEIVLTICHKCWQYGPHERLRWALKNHEILFGDERPIFYKYHCLSCKAMWDVVQQKKDMN